MERASEGIWGHVLTARKRWQISLHIGNGRWHLHFCAHLSKLLCSDTPSMLEAPTPSFKDAPGYSQDSTYNGIHGCLCFAAFHSDNP